MHGNASGSSVARNNQFKVTRLRFQLVELHYYFVAHILGVKFADKYQVSAASACFVKLRRFNQLLARVFLQEEAPNGLASAGSVDF